MKSLILALTLFSSLAAISAQASDRTAAYNLICKPMTFESDRANCLSKVKQYTYFDKRGLTFCAGLNFDTNKLSCLAVIGDKVYEGYEMDQCMSLTFESQKIDCLTENGTTYNPNRPSCVPRDEAISSLTNSLTDLRNGNVRNADHRISDLLQRFTDCI